MHPRVSLSAISTFAWELDADLDVLRRRGHHQRRDLGGEARAVRLGGGHAPRRRCRAAGDEPDRARPVPPRRARPVGRAARAARARPRHGDRRWAPSASCSPPGRPARSPGRRPPTRSRRRWRRCSPKPAPAACRSRSSTRTRCGWTSVSCTRWRTSLDLARRLDAGVCMEVNACWAERGLADTITAGADRLRLVQVSDFAVGTLSTPNRLVPGDGDIPLERILGEVLAAGYTGCFDLELIGPRIDRGGLRTRRAGAASIGSPRCSTRSARNPCGRAAVGLDDSGRRGWVASAERRAGTWQQRQ